ncbi:MAG: folate-binding protein YgfZ [Rhodobacteraceae bacterium]|nr:folate-binding protein YgfZ [Paracoccaceae bacterium]
MKNSRTVIKVDGVDSFDFLQGLVTNDVSKADNALVYTALLTPQGKYLADFFIFQSENSWFLDVNSLLADELVKQLSFYRLRSKVTIEKTDLEVVQGLGEAVDGAYSDPRHLSLGWRKYSENSINTPAVDWDQIRVKFCIPETLIELIPEKTFILESGFEKLNGVDFKKGCYVGQEVTSRMKHKTQLQKGLVRVKVLGSTPVGTEIRSEKGPVGYLYTQCSGFALAQIRFRQVQNATLTAGDALVQLDSDFEQFTRNG